MTKMRTLSFAVAAALATIGCRDIAPVTSPRVAPLSDVIALETSTVRLGADRTLSATARVRRPADAALIGSFTVAVAYDASRLDYLGEDELLGAIGAANVDADGRVVVAGASAHGFADGRLFTLHFRVRDPSGAERLSLSLRELHGIDAGDRRSSAVVVDGSRPVAAPATATP
jgi:hypothetical protein